MSRSEIHQSIIGLPDSTRDTAIVLGLEGSRPWFQKENPDLTKVAQLVERTGRTILEATIDEPWHNITQYMFAKKEGQTVRGVTAIQETVADNVVTTAKALSLSTEDPQFVYMSAVTYQYAAKFGDPRMQEHQYTIGDTVDAYKEEKNLGIVADSLDILLLTNLSYADRMAMLALLKKPSTKTIQRKLTRLQQTYTEKYGSLDDSYLNKIHGIEEVVEVTPVTLLEPVIDASPPTPSLNKTAVIVEWDEQAGRYIKRNADGTPYTLPEETDKAAEKARKDAEKQLRYEEMQQSFNMTKPVADQATSVLDTNWTKRAKCKGVDTNDLFTQGAAQNRSKLICRGCPVRTECLAEALDNRVEFGIYGGMTERERRGVLNRRPDVNSWRELLGEAKTEYDRLYPDEI